LIDRNEEKRSEEKLLEKKLLLESKEKEKEASFKKRNKNNKYNIYGEAEIKGKANDIKNMVDVYINLDSDLQPKHNTTNQQESIELAKQ